MTLTYVIDKERGSRVQGLGLTRSHWEGNNLIFLMNQFVKLVYLVIFKIFFDARWTKNHLPLDIQQVFDLFFQILTNIEKFQ